MTIIHASLSLWLLVYPHISWNDLERGNIINFNTTLQIQYFKMKTIILSCALSYIY